MNREKSVMGHIFDAALHAHRIEFADGSTDNLAKAQEFLQAHPDIAVILAINHLSTDDPSFAIRVKEMLDPDRQREWYGFASDAHLRDDLIAGPFVRAAASEFGVRIIPTIQQKVKDDPARYGYSDSDIRRNELMILRTLRDARQSSHGNIGVVTAPEGTRTQTRSLQEANEGFDHILTFLSPAIVVPLAIRYAGNWWRDFPNIGRKVFLNIGPFLLSSKPDEEFPQSRVLNRNEVMHALADLLPHHMRGVYESIP